MKRFAYRKLVISAITIGLLGSALPIGANAEEAAPVTLSATGCPTEAITLPLNSKRSRSGLVPASAYISYEVANAKIAKVTPRGLIVPVAIGSTEVSVMPASYGSDDISASCAIPIVVTGPTVTKYKFAPKNELRKVKIGNKTFAVQTVVMPKGLPADIGLAGGVVGKTENLQTIAERRKAEFAVNGTYFEAYGGIPEPYGTIIADGEIAHLSYVGTTVGFAADGRAKMDTLRMKIEGGGEGTYAYPHNWYAGFVNRTPTQAGTSSVLFTSARGSRIGFSYGMAIVVRKGVVEKITENENVAIPRDGYVVVLTGEKKNLGKKFAVGKKVHYRINYKNAAGQTVDWSDVVTAVGAGPRVLKDGQILIDAAKEGFTQPKILTQSAARSGIGIKADGSVILVTVGSATIKELGLILKSFGAVQGMNLDGGASSGLFAKGKLLTKPGRLISNALVFGSGLKSEP